MTHAELVERGLRWLKQHCTIAFAELKTSAMEVPDGWGFGGDGSVLLECKATRGDFLGDAKKYYRRRPEYGMGERRFYLCPPQLIQAAELPPHWGLLWCYPRAIRMVVPAVKQATNLYHERLLLASVARRCALRWPIEQIHDIRTRPRRRR